MTEPIRTEIKTAGVSSRVSEDRDVIGHVLMLEYDEVGLEVVRDDIERLGGPLVLCESSARSYHLWDLRIRSWPEVVEELLVSRADEQYVEEMIDRGRCVLRTHPKLLVESNDVVKPSPVVIDAIDLDDEQRGEDGDVEISRPHLKALRELNDGGLYTNLPERGDSMPVEYWSYSITETGRDR